MGDRLRPDLQFRTFEGTSVINLIVQSSQMLMDSRIREDFLKPIGNHSKREVPIL